MRRGRLRPSGLRRAYPLHAPGAPGNGPQGEGEGLRGGAMGLSASSEEVFALWESLCAPLCEGRRRVRSEVARAGSFVLSGRVHRIRRAEMTLSYIHIVLHAVACGMTIAPVVSGLLLSLGIILGRFQGNLGHLGQWRNR